MSKRSSSQLTGDPTEGDARRFECRVWASRYRLRPAPRKPGGFATLKKAYLASSDGEALTLSTRGQKRRQVPLAEVEGFTNELLTAGRQLRSQVLEWVLVGAVVGLVVAGVGFFLRPQGTALAPLDLVANLSLLFALGGGLALVGGLLWSIPSLLRIRTWDLFTLKFRNGGGWELGVPRQQAEEVVQFLQSHQVPPLPGS
jgi:hypothetical protein